MLAPSANRFARFVTWVSFVGLSLGVMVLTVVVTVMNGFDHELKTRLLSTVPHVTLVQTTESDQLPDTAAIVKALAANSAADDAAAFPYFRGAGAATGRGRVYPVALYGVPGTHAPVLTRMQAGLDENLARALAARPDGILLGAPLARALGVAPGSSVSIVVGRNREQQVRPQVLRFTLAGTFSLGAEPDYTLALVNLERYDDTLWRELGEVGMQVQLTAPLDARSVAAELAATFPSLGVGSWEGTYGELFSAVQLEKSMMFVLLLLVVAIAAFNIVAGQSMLVNDKARSIAILRTLGCTRSTIRDVFLMQGAVISVGGTGLGLTLGLGAAMFINEILDAAERVTGMHLLDGSFFVEVPTRVLPADLMVIGAMSVLLCMLSAMIPALRAAKMDPVSGLH